MKKIVTVFALFLFSLTCVWAQEERAETLEELLNVRIVPKPPEAAGLGEYGNIPVNYRTGVPNISIPVHTIQLKEFSYPLSLSYNAGGLVVNSTASRIGTGWTLNGDGKISAVIKGRPDLRLNGTTSFNSPAFPSDYMDNKGLDLEFTITSFGNPPVMQIRYIENPDHLQRAFTAAQGNYDSQPDEFSINLANLSQKFVMDIKDVVLGTEDFYTIPYRNLEIDYNPDSLSFVVVDEEGTTYYFKKYNTVVRKSFNFGIYNLLPFYEIPDLPVNPYGSNFFVGKDIVSNVWYLTKITTRFGEDIIFHYEEEEYTYIESIQESYFEYIHTPPAWQPPATPTKNSHITYVTYAGSRLKEIEVCPKNYSVNFIYSDNEDGRLDVPGMKQMTGIVVSTDTDTVKRIDFVQSYFESRHVPIGNSNSWEKSLHYRLKLDSVIIDNAKHYAFNYYGETENIPERFAFAQDYWGYYNGNLTNGTLIPKYDLTGVGEYPQGADREADSSFAKYGTLEKIHYPTQGYTKFIYGLKPGGGLVLSAMHNCEGSDTLLTKTFEYSGLKNQQYPIFSAITGQYISSMTDSVMKKTWYPSPQYDLFAYDAGEPYYSEVTEYNGTPTNNAGWTIRKYGLPANSPEYSDYVQLLSEEIYSNDTLRMEKTYHYTCEHNFNFWQEANSAHEKSIHGYRIRFKIAQSCPAIYCDYAPEPYRLEYQTYKLVSMWNHLDKEITKHYDTDGNLISESSKDYSYYTNISTHTYPWQITDSSFQTEIVTETEYVQDYPTENANLIDAHYLSAQVSSEKRHNGELVERLETTYQQQLPFHKEQIDVSFRAGASEDDIISIFYQYDPQGHNLQEFHREDGLETSFVWGYNQQYPIAKAVNALPAQIAYTGFEPQSKGGWDYDESHTTNTNQRTGLWSYNGTSGLSINKTINYDEPFIVSLWVYGNGTQATVGGNTKTNTTDGWGYLEWELSSYNGNIKVSATGPIDDLRLYPANAVMTTYTYEHLRGVTSITDENNVTTYFSRDDAGRLKEIRDEDRYILQYFNYNYKNQ